MYRDNAKKDYPGLGKFKKHTSKKIHRAIISSYSISGVILDTLNGSLNRNLINTHYLLFSGIRCSEFILEEITDYED